MDNNNVVTNEQFVTNERLRQYDAGIKTLIAIKTAVKQPMRYKMTKVEDTANTTYKMLQKDTKDTDFVEGISDNIVIDNTVNSTSLNAVSGKAVSEAINLAISGASSYLGTVNAVSELSTSATKGDFYRVRTAWDSTMHVGDIVISEKHNPSPVIGDGNWVVLHNETNTDTSVTAVENHYTPTGGTTISASSGAVTDITNSAEGVQVVTGVTKDAAGHVTGVTSKALKSVGATYGVATQSSNGLMSAEDKKRLDDVVAQSNGTAEIVSDETAISIKTVPAGCNTAMVTKISGKTQKVAQVFPTTIAEGLNQNAVTSSSYNADAHEFTVKSTGAMSGFYLTNAVLTFGHSYYLTSTFKIPKAGTVRLVRDFTVSAANTYTTIETVEKINSNATIYNVGAESGETFYLKDVMVFDLTEMFGVGNEPTSVAQIHALGMFGPYVPKGSYLWNAPVESVVSQGINRIEKIIKQSNVGANGVITSGPTETFDLCIAKVEAGKQYTFSERAIFAYFTSIPSVGSVSYDNSRDTSFNATTITAPITGYVAARRTLNTNFMIVEGTTVPSTYIEPNEAAVLVPSDVKNLPDYGIEGNIIDLENGVYYHTRAALDLGDITFQNSQTSGWYSTIPAKKVGVNVVFSGRYTFDTRSFAWTDFATYADKSIACNSANNYIYIKDTSITASDVADGRIAKLKGERIIIELETPEIIPISDFIHPITCEPGGTISLVNEYNLDVPNTILYKKEV